MKNKYLGIQLLILLCILGVLSSCTNFQNNAQIEVSIENPVIKRQMIKMEKAMHRYYQENGHWPLASTSIDGFELTDKYQHVFDKEKSEALLHSKRKYYEIDASKLKISKNIDLKNYIFDESKGEVYLVTNHKSNQKPLLSDIERFNVFYNNISSDILADMIENYQLLILDPFHTTAEQIEELQEVGVMLYGYMSVAHIGKWDENLLDKLEDEDYLKIGGKQITYGDEPIGDIRQEHYQKVLLETIEERLLSKGFDGVFIDTTEYYEQPAIVFDKGTRESLITSTVDFFSMLKESYPEVSIFQNRGFEILDRGAKRYIDAILYEDYDAQDTEQKYLRAKNKINESISDFGVQCFAISSLNNDSQRIAATKMGWKFMYLDAEDNYIKWNFSEK